MLLVRRGDGFAGAGDGLSVSGAVLTRDAISRRVCRLSAVAVIFCTAQKLGRPRTQQGPQATSANFATFCDY